MFLFSQEGVTQGDPLSTLLYAAGTLPLIQSLKNPSNWIQVWYADDASACGELSSIRQWFDLLLQRGPAYGYFPNPKKSCVVVDHSFVASAKKIFVTGSAKTRHVRIMLNFQKSILKKKSCFLKTLIFK